MGGPRVVIVMPEDWPRALLRTRLRDRGYDAVAAPSLADALVYPPSDPERGPVRLLVLDQAALDADAAALDRFLKLHRGARVLLLAFSAGGVPPGPWTAVVRRPFRGGEVPRAVEELLPLMAAGRRPGEE